MVLKHAGGIDPVRYASMVPETRAIFEKARDEQLAIASEKTKKEREDAQAEYTAKIVRENAERELRLHYEKLASERKISVGMPDDLVIKAWGPPERKNTSSSGFDQWVYPSAYVYFQNGRLTSWQSSERAK